MNWNPVKFVAAPIKWRSALLLPFLMAYIAAAFVIFFTAVIPSYQNDSTSWTFAVDSTQYVYMADSLRSGHPDPWVLAAFVTFPNTVITPVFLAFVLNSPLWEMIVNFVIFGASIAILARTFSISPVALTALLLLNATTTTSILCVNKEILDLLFLSMFFYSLRMGKRKLLILTLALAFVNRYEFCLVMLAFLFACGRWNPSRHRRLVTAIGLVLALSFATPLLGRQELLGRFQESEYAGFVRAMDQLQLNYLYFVAVIPKIAENIFGQLLNPLVWREPTSWLYINWANNLSYVVLIVTVFIRRQLRLRNDLIYFAAIGSVIIAQSLVVQPRYFYFVYVLLCVQAAHNGSTGPSLDRSSNAHPDSPERGEFGRLSHGAPPIGRAGEPSPGRVSAIGGLP
jgi:hypothetical protein